MLSYELPLDENRRMLRIKGIPRAKPRQTNRDRWQPSKSVQHYRAWADAVRNAWRAAFPGTPWTGAIALSCVFEFPIPASWNKAQRELAARGRVSHTSAPDLDNLIKGITDALNNTAWEDDRQIVGYLEPMTKLWTPVEQAGAWITVERQE